MFFRRNPFFKSDGYALIAQVRTSKKQEVIQIRISKSSELSQEAGGYFVRKTLIGPKTLDQAVLEVSLTRGYRVKQATVDGGDLIPVKEWEDIS